MTLTAIVFDLDNCLAPAHAIGPELLKPACAAITAANDGSVSQETLAKAFADIWIHAFDWVARQYHFTPAMFAAGWQELSQLEVTGTMQGYPDLHELAAIGADRFLVTTGFRKLQESKIRALGIAHLFRGIVIDAIEEVDRKGKRGYFQDIMTANAYDRQEVLIVGDNPESEIAAGNSLGLRTVQILRPGVVRSPDATFHVAGLRELHSSIEL